MRVRVVVRARVSRGGHEEYSGVVARPNGAGHGVAVSAAAPAIVGNADVHVVDGPHHGGVVDCPHGVGEVSPAAAGEELQTHDRPRPIHAEHATSVVAGGRDGPGDVSAVAVVVHGVAVVVDEIVAVVDEAVPVVVDPVAGDLAGVGPYIGAQIDVVVIDARIDHADHDVAASGGDIPRGGRVDVGVGPAADLAVVFQAPKRGEIGVVGRGLHLMHDVQLVTGDVGVTLERVIRRFGRGALAANQHQPGQPQAAEDLELHAGADQQLGGLGYGSDPGQRLGVELHDPVVSVYVAGVDRFIFLGRREPLDGQARRPGVATPHGAGPRTTSVRYRRHRRRRGPAAPGRRPKTGSALPAIAVRPTMPAKRIACGPVFEHTAIGCADEFSTQYLPSAAWRPCAAQGAAWPMALRPHFTVGLPLSGECLYSE